MAFVHTFTRNWSDDTGASIQKAVTATGGATSNLDEALPIGTDTPIVFTLDISQVKSFYMVCDTACVIETNSSGSAVNVFTLVADKPYAFVAGVDGTWKDTAGTTVTTDITILYATNAVAGQLQIRALYDPTV